MASLSDRLEQDLVTAMKGGDDLTRDTLRMLKTALTNKRIEKQADLTDEDVLVVLRKEAKSRQEAVDQYRQAGRAEQADKEAKEKKILEQYLPAGLAEQELEQLVTDAIKTVGATSGADIGKVMGVVMPKVAGRVDGGTVSSLVKKHLS